MRTEKEIREKISTIKKTFIENNSSELVLHDPEKIIEIGSGNLTCSVSIHVLKWVLKEY